MLMPKDTDQQIVVARQAIFDANNNVVGYELLHQRLTNSKYVLKLSESGPALNTIAHGIDLVVNAINKNQKIFINIPRKLLLDDKYLLLNKDKYILELAGPDAVTQRYSNILSKAKSRGYLMACDIHDPGKLLHVLPYIDYAKVDFTQFQDRSLLQDITGSLQKFKLHLLAEKVETLESMDYAKHLGYQFFQGYFFSTPQLFHGKTISPSLAIQFNLMYELHKSHTDYNRLADLIASDPVLSFKLLKFVNSPFFGQSEAVTSIKRALSILGASELIQWININLLSNTAFSDMDKELVYMSAFRSRFLSSLRHALPSLCNLELEMCLPALFSLLDAILKIPFRELFSQIPCLHFLTEVFEDSTSRCHKCMALAAFFEKQDIEKINYYKRRLPDVDFDSINLDAHMWANCAIK